MAYRYDPIFYDRGHHRWKYSKWVIGVASVFLVALFSFTVLSITNFPGLPALNLAKPLPNFRGVSSVPKLPTNQARPAWQNQAVLAASSAAGISNQPYQPKVIGFYVNWDDTSFSSLKSNLGKMDELIPEWLHLNGTDGSLTVDDQAQQDKVLEYIRQNRPDIPIVPLINNYSQQNQEWDSQSLVGMLGNPAARAKTIQGLLDFIERYKFSGISIDFEAVPDASQPALAVFMKELYEKFHPLGLEVSQNIPLDDPAFDAKLLGQFNDFLILMAYDDHSIYDSLAGPVADQNWYMESLLGRFSQLPPDRYVISVGNYGYDWEDKKIDGIEVTFQDAVRTANESAGKISIDPESLNPTFDYYDKNDVLRHVWYLDAVTTFNEMSAVKKYAPRGFALWRLGSEDPAVWKVFEGRIALGQEVAESLQKMNYGYDVDYEGQGEVLKVTAVPKEGMRSIKYDAPSGFITEQVISDFPSPYIITRWGGKSRKKIALTFDDGPDSFYTPKILDIFKKYGAKGTFFVIGTNANQMPELVQRAVDEGHEIGNHTFSHPNISTVSDRQFKLELSASESLFGGIIGRHTHLFRPPYAEDIEPETPDQINPLLTASSAGYYTVAMHIDPKDWNGPGADAIVQRVIDGAKNGQGNIVLLHDGGGDRGQTIAALPKIIEGLRDAGFKLVTVSDLIGVPQASVMPAVSITDRLRSKLNGVTFNIIDVVGGTLAFLFALGILLGVFRLLFIQTLANIQWSRCRKNKNGECIFPAGFFPKASIVVPAYNEEKVILATVNSLLNSDYPDFEIIAVDDGSEDATHDLLIKNFSDNPRVKIFTKANGGKATALNFGINRAEAEIIITLDADTLFKSDTVSKLVRHFANPKVGAVAGNAKVGNRINLLTRWQALEYITSQNLDRRAFALLNCISVVPGAVGAWKRQAITEAGGFSALTLAEDTDLTFAIIRRGYKVEYEDEALAFTEAPDTVRNFIKQRFRWMYGSFQAVWKHRDTLLRPRYGTLGLFSVPNVFLFQIFFPLISPFMDLMLVASLAWASFQKYHHPLDYSATHPFREVLGFYLFFLAIDLLTAFLAFSLERRREDWTLLIWLPFQRFFYRQLMYYVAIKTTFTALKGKVVGWKKFERKATAEVTI